VIDRVLILLSRMHIQWHREYLSELHLPKYHLSSFSYGKCGFLTFLAFLYYNFFLNSQHIIHNIKLQFCLWKMRFFDFFRVFMQ